MNDVGSCCRRAGKLTLRGLGHSRSPQRGSNEWRRKSPPKALIAAVAGCLCFGCSSDDEDSGDTDSGAVADASPADATAVPDAMGECANAVCGTVSYSGAYTGSSATIYLRVYKETGSVSDNPIAAVGDPDFSTSIASEGDYRVDIEGYEGNLYVSAFMDVDGTGEESGPSGNSDASDGVYSDPLGAYGGYTFEGTPETEPTPIAFTAAGVSGIDIELADTGVITGVIHEGGGGSGPVVVGAFVPEAGGKFLHHTHAPAFVDGMRYHIAIPPGDHWLIRANVGAGSVGFYPDNPPPAPPANASPVSVTANAVTDGIDITLSGS